MGGELSTRCGAEAPRGLKPTLRRVLITTDAVGGVWRYTLDLAAELARQGVEVAIASLGPRPSLEQKRQVWRIPGAVLRESDFALEWMPNPWRDVNAAGEWLLGLESEFSPDLIHLNGYAHAALSWSRPVLVMAHSCVCSWWRAVHGRSPGREWEEYRRRVARGLHACDAVAAPSVFMAYAIEREYGVSAQTVHVIYNFSRARICATEAKQPFFLAAGRAWDAAKNFQLLDRIARRLSWLMKIAATLSYPELQREMARAAVFVHPALYEPFGLSVLEAARHRCALVLSDIPSLRELWDHAALFVDPRDEDRWIFELDRLSSNRPTCDNLARLAYSRAAQYSAASAMRQYLSLYSALLSEPRPLGSGLAQRVAV
ncbi:MAG TPA: glycosyltransferase family 4 protein [Bryobacteraceae bacterium]